MNRRTIILIAVLGVAVIAAVGGMVISGYRETFFKPRPIDRQVADRSLRPTLGVDADSLRVPAVFRDVNAIFATATLSEATIGRIRGRGKARMDLPGTTWEFAAGDRICLVELTSRPARIMILDGRDSRHRDVGEVSFRKWLQFNILPWRE